MNNDEMIKATHDAVQDIQQLLKGYDGHGGLLKQVENNTKQINKLWIAIAVIAAGTGGSGFAIVQALLG